MTSKPSLGPDAPDRTHAVPLGPSNTATLGSSNTVTLGSSNTVTLGSSNTGPASPPVLVVTGASGRLGRALVPLLTGRGLVCRLVGRDPKRLASRFAGLDAGGYDDLPRLLPGADAVLHLAALNNDANADLAAYRAVNGALAIRVAREAHSAGVARFIDIGSTHAANGSSPYAVSKREGARALDAFARDGGWIVVRLVLPAVRGVGGGRLARLERLPGAARGAALALAGALKPTVGVETVAAAVVDASSADRSSERVISDRQGGNPVYGAVMRAADLAAALVMLGPGAVVLLTVWLWLKAGGETSPILRQLRIGRHGRAFTCYKFRTMRQGTALAGTHEVPAAAITKAGAVLRRTKLDELPQAWNVLWGEMSLVGPRPCLPVQTALIDARRRLGVFDARPGITGWAQIRGVDMSDPERLAALDADYVARRTVPFDLAILLRTLIGQGRGDRVGEAGLETGPQQETDPVREADTPREPEDRAAPGRSDLP